jgi:hypothetical protein
MYGYANIRDVVSNFFGDWNASSRSAFQTYFSSFFRRLVMGLTILEKFGMNLR